jgi:hypothetical protein
MKKYRIVRKHHARFYGDGSEGFSWNELIKEIAQNGIMGARFIRHDNKGPGGSRQLTKIELFNLLKDVASFVRQKPN